MEIFLAIKKDLGTGSITGEVEQSYVIPYYIFTDNLATPYFIYEQASKGAVQLYSVENKKLAEKLPIYGDSDSNLSVTNINIERVSENNLKAIPQFRLNPITRSNRSYTCWSYTVTFTASEEEDPWESDEAINCTWSPKTYECYDNKTLIPNYHDNNDPIYVPNYPLGEERYMRLLNTVGDDKFRNRTLYNYLLNFSYAVKNFDYNYLPLYLNSMNLTDCVVAGIPIKKYHAVINDMRVEQAKQDDILYYVVHVEIEVQYQYRLTYDEYMSSGYRAYRLEGSKSAIDAYLRGLGLTRETAGFVYKFTSSSTVKKYPVLIEELSDDRYRDSVPDQAWFSKKKGFGYFNGINCYRTKQIPYRSNPRPIYLRNGSTVDNVGATDIYFSYAKPSEDPNVLQTTYRLYLVKDENNSPIYTDNGWVYSTVEGDIDTQLQKNYRFIATEKPTIGVWTDPNAVSLTKYVTKTEYIYDVDDVFAGQYDSVKEPKALNKYGGLYLAEGETSASDDINENLRIDMSDPMLGKIQDYQHIARDWSALAFPKKGMFHTTLVSDMNTKLWKSQKRKYV